jgi:predicted RNA-binding protein YlxR (DUF448 family)
LPIIKERICVACRQSFNTEKLIRLTVEPSSSKIILNMVERGDSRINGRSAYICLSIQCANAVLKGSRLKFALTGRHIKSELPKRNIIWPLESQLIKDILAMCTEPGKTCQNTRVRGA